MNQSIQNLSESLNTNKFWKTYISFCSDLPDAKDIDISELIEIIPGLIKRMENDLSSHKIYDAIGTLILKQPEKGRELYKNIRHLPQPAYQGFISRILKSLQAHEDDAYIRSEIGLLLTEKDPFLRLQGFAALLNFDALAFPEDLLLYIENEIHENLDKDLPYWGLIVSILVKFRRVIPWSENKINFLAGLNIPHVQNEIITLLESEITYSEEPKLFEELLFKLESIQPEYKRLFENFNYGLFYNPTLELTPLIISFFEKWLKYDTTRSKDIMLFEEAIVRLNELNPELFSKMLTSWLSADEKVLHQAVEQIILGVSLRDIKEVELSIELVYRMEPVDINFLIAKIIGYIHFKEPLREMFYSIIRAKSHDPRIINLLIGVFTEYLIINYPSTLDYLKEKKKSATKKEREIISRIEKIGNKYYNDIRNLLVRNEFASSESRLTIYNEIHKKGFLNKQEEDEKHDTSFLSGIKKIQLRTGKGMYSKYKDSYTDKTEMHAYNYNAELPRIEFIDQIGQEKIRRLNRLYKRK